MQTVIGVDGGNSKTDYLLHAMDGRLLAHTRAGTCSHEHIGVEGAVREMQKRIHDLLARNHLAIKDVAGAAFGLAGIDQSEQHKMMTDAVSGMGFARFVAMNDSFLGIKAGIPEGIGVSSVNGAGTSCGGIDRTGKWVQVSGLGSLSSDDGGGTFLAVSTLRAVYNEIYRFGQKTALTEKVLSRLQCPREDFHLYVSTKYQYGTVLKNLDVIQMLFSACAEGDTVAQAIAAHTGRELGTSAAGVATRLAFPDVVPVALCGSVWTKGRNPFMILAFEQAFEAHAGKPCKIHILSVPPAAGSVLWALELALGHLPDATIKAQVLADLEGM